MDVLSIFLLVLILAGFLAALRSIWKKKGNPCGSCSGDCGSCSSSYAVDQGKKKS